MASKQFVSRDERQRILLQLIDQAGSLSREQLEQALSWLSELIEEKKTLLEQRQRKTESNPWGDLISQSGISQDDIDKAFGS